MHLLIVSTAAIIATLAIVYIPWLQVRRMDIKDLSAEARLSLLNELRRTTIQIIGGSAILMTFYFGLQQLQTGERDALRVAYAAALGALSSPSAQERLSAAYTLTDLGQLDTVRPEPLLAVLCFQAIERTSADDGVHYRKVGAQQTALLYAITQIRSTRITAEEIDPGTCDLSQGNFTGVRLHDANFSGLRANEAIFDTSYLSSANFSGASLIGASFNYTNLRHANFAGAKLDGASFEGADLRDAYFDNNLTDEQRRHARPSR